MEGRVVELLCRYSGMVAPAVGSSHAPLVGEVSARRLAEAAPAWRDRTEGHRPSPRALEALRRQRVDTEIVTAFGTWCHLSEDLVPELQKLVETAANPRVRMRLVAVNPEFLEPRGAIRELGLVNVPTVIVRQEGRETGRLVETPAAAGVEEELVEILTGRPRRHPGRWSRGPLAAHGTYLHRRGDAPPARERWELYSLPEGGALLRSEVQPAADGAGRLEAWLRLDARGRPQLAELTGEEDGTVVRTRLVVDGDELIAWSRGSAGGTVRQRLSVRGPFAFLPPVASAAGWPWLQARSDGEVTAYRPAGAALGELTRECCRVDSEPVEVDTPAGSHRTRRLVFETGGGAGAAAELWLHQDLLVPLRGRIEGVTEHEAESLEVRAATLWEGAWTGR